MSTCFCFCIGPWGDCPCIRRAKQETFPLPTYQPMFHQANNLFFTRLPNGDVRILKLRYAPMDYPTASSEYHEDNVILDVTIPSDHWCSIIATVCHTSESYFNPVTNQHRWYDAKHFHNGDPA